jgi:hypothetical protein
LRVASRPAGGGWSAVGLMPGIKFTSVMPSMPCVIVGVVCGGEGGWEGEGGHDGLHTPCTSVYACV